MKTLIELKITHTISQEEDDVSGMSTKLIKKSTFNQVFIFNNNRSI